MTGTVRYDPAGTATSVTGSVPDFRFQSSWADEVTRLSWVVTRWYAPAQGRFISEDTLLGEPRDPDSRHLYAYGAGDPVGAWDPDGRSAAWTTPRYSARPAWRFLTLTNPKRVKGRLVLGLFIEAATSPVRVVGNMIQLGVMDGDSRTWASGPVPCSESRGCVTVDFDRKLLSIQLNPTCGWFWPTATPYGCSDQFKFNCGAAWYMEEYNCLFAREDPSTGRISLRWDLTQSRMPIIRPDRTINGKMTITPTRFGGSVVYTGDQFPKQEMYYFVGTKRYKVFQTGQSNEPNGMAHPGTTINGSFRTYFV